jgi:hypothetical protein
MEILKFDESGTSSPSRKRSGRGAILVTFVALVFGAGTALASGTLTINNSNNTIALDQGVANSVQCDTTIDVALDAPYNTTAEDFLLNGVNVTNIDASSGKCLGKYFKIKIYNSNGAESVFCIGSDAVAAAAADSPPRTITADEGCSSDGKYSKKVVSSSSLSFSFTKGMKTGEPDPDSTASPRPRLVRVKNVTVESSDS